MNNYKKRADEIITELESAIELENETIDATSSNDRKAGCQQRIHMAKWGIKICNFIITGKQEAQ